MKCLVLCALLVSLIIKTWAIITFPTYVPIITLPVTEIGDMAKRFFGIPKNVKTDSEYNRWWEQEMPGYRKFVTEQILKEEEENRKAPPWTTKTSSEWLDELGSWGHYYDYGTREIERFDKKNPPDQNKLPHMVAYRRLKKMIQHKQKLQDEGYKTEWDPELLKAKEDLKKWASEERKAGRLKCECSNCTERITERYSVAPDDLHPTFSRESMSSKLSDLSDFQNP